MNLSLSFVSYICATLMIFRSICFYSYISNVGLYSSHNLCILLGVIHLVRTQNFPKNQYFLPPDTYTSSNQWVRNKVNDPLFEELSK